MKITLLVGTLLFFLNIQTSFAYTDVYFSLGKGALNYSEQTDGLDEDISVQEGLAGIRLVENFSVFDLGAETGYFALARNFQNQTVDFQSDYINVYTGLSFPLFTKMIELSFDLGYKLSSSDIQVIRNVGNTTDTYSFVNVKNYDPFSKIGIRTIFFKTIFLGVSVENMNLSIKDRNPDISPEIKHTQSILLSIGYRFGEKKTKPNIKAGKIYDLDCFEYGMKECLR